jgi:Zn-dependent metalloprotease
VHIVPPYVLESIVLRGSESQRAAAVRTLAVDASRRQARAVNLAARGSGPRQGPDALAAITAAGPDRTIADAGHGTSVTGLPEVRREGAPPTGDAAVDEAYDGLGHTYVFWRDAYGRRSIDDADLPLLGVVHYGVDYDNAFWDGRRMVFGDGDGELFVRFTRSLDVIGHELGHGVIEDEVGLVYQGQPGALNESIADVLGSLVKQYTLGQVATEADWLIGPDVRGPAFRGVALRSMRAPGTAYDDPILGRDPQPAHMDGYVTTTEDNGGVHINSGIPNKAFADFAIALGGSAWERAGRVWYETLRDSRLSATASFDQFAALTHDVATARLGAADAGALAAAWSGVGIAA